MGMQMSAATATPAIFGEALTMSSREIADLCETRHNQVVETIERLMSSGVLRESRNTTRRVQPQGGGRPLDVYDLTKRDTLVVASGYRDDLRARIIDRWIELEQEKANGGFQIPRTIGEALRLAADQAEQIEEMKPKVLAFERLDTAEGNLTVRPASKVLGVPEHKFTKWMEVNRWAFRQNGKGSLQAYVEKRNAGYLDHKLGRYVDSNTGEDKVSATLVITPKGMAQLAQIFAKEGVAQ